MRGLTHRRARVFAIAAFLLIAAACGQSKSTAVHCGTERWSVKTLSDGDATRVNFTPVQSNVAELRSLGPPSSLPQSSRIAPTEEQAFTITAHLLEFRLEDDMDIHLVVADPANPAATMIAEFADADHCSGAVDSTHAAEMKAARASLIASFGEPIDRFQHISGMATITGVGFFDFIHGQTGVAPNGIELHPVLEFALVPPASQ